MTPEQLVAALTAEIEELRLAIRAEQLQPDGAISPEWVPAFRGYVRTLSPERRLTMTLRVGTADYITACREFGLTP